MPETTEGFDQQQAMQQLEAAAADQRLSSGAVTNIRTWLTESRYAPYAAQVAEHLAAGQWKELDDAFWTIIPFGTGGRRGRMYPIGSNAINDRTIGESAQGLAEYVRQQAGDEGALSCAIAYDTRHNSPHFARLCAEIMVAAGFRVYFLDDYRSTPELSFLVRYKQCSCGIMVTASHNPPSDNAVKVYWSTGGQILPPHDKGVIDRVMNVGAIERADFDTALAEGQIELCTAEVDAAFLSAAEGPGPPGPAAIEGDLLTTAWCGSECGRSGNEGGRLRGSGSFRRPRAAGWRFSQCAEPCRESGECRGLRLDHRTGERSPRRTDSGFRPRLRSTGMCCTADDRSDRALGYLQRQPAGRLAGRLRAGTSTEVRHAHPRPLSRQNARHQRSCSDASPIPTA